MLWTDRDFVTVDDILSLDVEVVEIANAESISLDGPGGIIQRSIEEAGDTIMRHARQFGGSTYNGAVTPGHYAAVMNVGLPAVNRFKILLSQVVVSGINGSAWTAIKRWAAYWALSMFYRDASNRTVNDRYAAKMVRYREDTHVTHWEAVRSTGIPTVVCPLPCPGALYEFNAGTFDASAVSLVSGSGASSLPANVYVTWYDGTKTVNNESGSSVAVPATLQAGKVLRVDISGLTPPNGSQPLNTLPIATVAYGNATGWNVYVATGLGLPVKQNSAPIPIAQKTYTLTGDPAVSGTRLGTGQYAEMYLHFQRTVDRG